MQIVCISRGSQSKGVEFAEKLAAKLGYECVSREQLLEEATRSKIPIGKLETAIVKPHIFSEQLALELEHYKSLATSILCEKALKNNIVYHGRTGHLLLPGVGHILKIRVVSDMEYRLQYVMQKLELSRRKAQRYLKQIEEDRRRWVKKFYHVEWDVFTLYDLVLNLSNVSVDNAASAVCSMAQLPEYQATPATINTMKDLYLASRARLALARDTRTNRMNVKVRANNGVIHATYLSQEVKEPGVLVSVLQGLEDAREIVCTKAETNILWIQETFGPVDRSYDQVLSVANTLDAAVELIKIVPGEEPESIAAKEDTTVDAEETWRETGIIDEGDTEDEREANDISKVYEKLINDGRAGGKRAIQGSQRTLLTAIDRSVNYRLIILDNVFVGKGAAVRKRLCREWSNSLSDALKTPVISLDEIVARYRFGVKQAVRLLVFAAITAGICFMVFHFDREILSFLSREGLQSRFLSIVFILVFVPSFAYSYSTVTRLLLKMMKLD